MNSFSKDKYKFSLVSPLRLIGDDVIEETVNEINYLTNELTSYKVLLRDLINYEIDYNLRNELLNIAFFIIENIELYEEFTNTNILPINSIYIKVGKAKKYLTKWEDYIISYIIILGNPRYKHIQEYMQVIKIDKDNNSETENVINYEDLKGLLLTKSKISGLILTSTGEFKKININKEARKGDEVEGKQGKSLKHYKLQISIFLVVVVLLSMFIGVQYKSSVTTIVINSTSKIKIDINKFNRVVNAYSGDGEGKELINEIKISDRDIDTALCNVIKYVDEKGMIPESGIIITISGKPIKYNSISETEKYIYEKKLEIRFNNSGMEHKLN